MLGPGQAQVAGAVGSPVSFLRLLARGLRAAFLRGLGAAGASAIGLAAPGAGRRPLCAHLGGVLRRNDAEGTWDYPLHGSRFAEDGSVLEGPATRPLSRR